MQIVLCSLSILVSDVQNTLPHRLCLPSPISRYMVAVLVLDHDVEVSVSDPEVSVEVSVKVSEVSVLAVLTPAAAATGSAKRTEGRAEERACD